MRDAIARAVDDDPPGDATLGAVTLRPHQCAAVRHLRRALREYGGALLADAPGLGKTYTALALARDAGTCVVAAPASLRQMWREAAAAARVPVTFVSLERLSRGVPVPPAGFVIVDEAHHTANPQTRRYAALAAAATTARLLLLTATPVRNRTAERDALLALFLGARAAFAGDDTLARCIVRRDTAGDAAPGIERRPPVRIPAVRGIATPIRALPPPLAPSDGSDATGLVRMGLARAWASSAAALERMLRRREQRGLALQDALRAGTRPSRNALRTWIQGDDAVQLPLPFAPNAPGTPDLAQFHAVVARHLDAVRALRDVATAARPADTTARTKALLGIAARHTDEVVIAFTGFDATAVALWHALRTVPGVVLLTGRGARSAGGPLARSAVLDALGPDAARATTRAFAPRLVIATDVLAEGVNLQRASVVVHLDWPWTPSALAQRVGRAARIGAWHSRVVEYRFAPPPAAERLVRTAWRHARKARAATAAIAPAHEFDAVLGTLARWRRDDAAHGARIAAAWGSCDAWLVRVESPARAMVLAVTQRDTRPVVTDRAETIGRVAAEQSDDAAPEPGAGEIRRVHAAVGRWLARAEGRAAVDRGAASSVAARRVAARLGRVVAHAPPAQMATVAARVGRVRAIMAEARGLAVELHYRAMLERHVGEAEWLEELERRLRDVPLMVPGRERATIVALLAVRRR